MSPTDLILHYGYLAVFVVVGLESLGVPLPGETTLVAAALYAGATHQLNIAGVIAAASAGAIIGDNIGYLVGHQGGYRLLVRYGRYVRLDARRVKLVRYLFLRYGAAVVFFGRFVAILRTYAALFAGTARMPWRTFVLFNAAGGIAWSVIYGTAAYFLGTRVTTFSGRAGLVLAAFGAAALVAAAVFVRRQEHRLQEAADKAFP